MDTKKIEINRIKFMLQNIRNASFCDADREKLAEFLVQDVFAVVKLEILSMEAERLLDEQRKMAIENSEALHSHDLLEDENGDIPICQ